PNEILGTGIVQTEEEKKLAEEAERIRREEEEAERIRLEAEDQERLRREKRENSFTYRTWRSLKKFFGQIIEDESE
ncbi:MAG: cell division protein FtsA, partial [Prevotella sp.]|nr:cell division protein FtsA [Prevotella sp.]